ncbi:TPA: hypothetical protein ACXNLO_001330 [Enterobacter cloacae]
MTFTKEQLIAAAVGRIEMAEEALANDLVPLARHTFEIDLELARIALASLEAEAVGEVIEQQSGMMLDGLVISEKPIYRNIKGIHNMKMMPLGTKFYTAHPAPVSVPDDVMAAMQKVARIRLDLNDFDGDKRGILDCLGDAEEALIEVVNRRAAMLQGADSNSPAHFRSRPAQSSLSPAQGGNSPVIPDGWVMVPRMLTPRMITKLQQKTEIGSYIAANWAGAYDLFQKFWDEAIAAAPQQEVK